MAHSLEASVIEVEMRQFNLIRIQAFGVNCEAVIVRRYFNPAVASVLHRLISAAVAEFEFESLTAEGDAEQLMPQTYAEDRRCAEKPFYLAHDFRQRRGVARTIG